MNIDDISIIFQKIHFIYIDRIEKKEYNNYSNRKLLSRRQELSDKQRDCLLDEEAGVHSSGYYVESI